MLKSSSSIYAGRYGVLPRAFQKGASHSGRSGCGSKRYIFLLFRAHITRPRAKHPPTPYTRSNAAKLMRLWRCCGVTTAVARDAHVGCLGYLGGTGPNGTVRGERLVPAALRASSMKRECGWSIVRLSGVFADTKKPHYIFCSRAVVMRILVLRTALQTSL